MAIIIHGVSNMTDDSKDTGESMLMPIVRHLVQFGAGVLVTQGFISADDLQGTVGAVLSMAAVAWGICKRRKVRICQM